MEYYLEIKSDDVLIHAATWMNLENIIHAKGKKPVRKGHTTASHRI